MNNHTATATGATSWPRLALQLTGRSLRSPSLAIALLRVAWRFRKRGWYKVPPFLPLPPRDYIRWRMYTAYGDYDAIAPADDLERYARWAVRAQ
ncbi:MAG: hypothetical protein JJD97_08455 [Gemmatimonadaceae bacterium]|nr:hypothetical protein [Gemmatimonadaceae bacterium]